MTSDDTGGGEETVKEREKGGKWEKEEKQGREGREKGGREEGREEGKKEGLHRTRGGFFTNHTWLGSFQDINIFGGKCAVTRQKSKIR